MGCGASSPKDELDMDVDNDVQSHTPKNNNLAVGIQPFKDKVDPARAARRRELLRRRHELLYSPTAPQVAAQELAGSGLSSLECSGVGGFDFDLRSDSTSATAADCRTGEKEWSVATHPAPPNGIVPLLPPAAADELNEQGASSPPAVSLMALSNLVASGSSTAVGAVVFLHSESTRSQSRSPSRSRSPRPTSPAPPPRSARRPTRSPLCSNLDLGSDDDCDASQKLGLGVCRASSSVSPSREVSKSESEQQEQLWPYLQDDGTARSFRDYLAQRRPDADDALFDERNTVIDFRLGSPRKFRDEAGMAWPPSPRQPTTTAKVIWRRRDGK